MNQAALPMEMSDAVETKRYLADDLLTYIGNKRALLPFIRDGLSQVKSRLGKGRLACVDLFAGSGVVSRLMKGHANRLVSNDFEDYAEAINGCYLSNRSQFPREAYREARGALLDKMEKSWRRGMIAENYAPADDERIQPGERVFYTRRNAEFLDTARQHIAEMPDAVRGFFMGPLLVRASVHSNTGGVFKGFYKNRQGVGAFGGEKAQALKRIMAPIDIPEPIFSERECEVRVTKHDATEFHSRVGGEYDLVYLDPPYNQHPYGSNYFMLNLILHYRMPAEVSRVSGIPKDWKRSPFNRPRECARALFKIIDDMDSKFFLISYSSEGFIHRERFISELQRRGRLSIFERAYNTYRACRNLMGRPLQVREYLFLLEKG